MTHADIFAVANESGQGPLQILRELKRLRRYGRGYVRNAPALIGLTLISRVAEALSVGLVVLFLQAVLGDKSGEAAATGMVGAFADWVQASIGQHLWGIGAAVVGITLARIVAEIILGFIDSKVYCEMADEVRRDIHAQYFHVSYAYIANHDQADLMNVVENESEQVPEAFQSVMELAQEVIAVLVFGVMVLLVSWRIGLLAGVGGAVLLGVSHLMAKPIEKLNGVIITQHRRLMQRILVGLQGMRAIRAFGQEGPEKQRFARQSRKLRDTHRRIDVMQTWIDPVNELGYLVLLAGLVLVGVWLDPALTSTVTALALLYRLLPHAAGLRGATVKLVTMTPHLSVVRSVLDRGDKIYPPEGDQPFGGLKEAIRFEGVTMTYAGAERPSLTEASFCIPAGKTTALLGPSGAGKTTVVNLLLRLYQPDAGVITADGAALPTLARTGWLHRIALAGQDVDLVEGTVATNLRLSRPSASLAQVRRAAEIAGILEDIDALADGFGTWIGERGLMVSGGQRQRIGLARALLCEPDILILDEATSALEETLEQSIRERILALFAGRTIVLITHRLHTIAAADHAVWLEKGRVLEEGPPASLQRLVAAEA